MAKELVEYSARLQAAVDKILINPAFSVQGGRRIRGRNTLTDRRGGDGGGEVALGVLVSGPSGGYGPAVWRAITVNPDGTWTATGEEVPVIVPLLK